MNSYLLLKIGSVLIASFSQILLKKSSNKKYPNIIREYLNFLVIFGYFLFFISSILSVYSLRGISISSSTVIESLSYILVPILSYFFFKEKLNNKQLIGIVIITIGIIVFNL